MRNALRERQIHRALVSFAFAVPDLRRFYGDGEAA
jgi:hypothetical protein